MPPGVAVQHAGQDAVEIGGDRPIQFARRGVDAAFLEGDNFGVRLADEWHFPGEQVIQRGSEGKDVAAAIDEPGVEHLLVRHIPRCSESLVQGGQIAGFGQVLGQTQVGELGDTGRGQQDIARLDSR